jgi:hypothetical protein
MNAQTRISKTLCKPGQPSMLSAFTSLNAVRFERKEKTRTQAFSPGAANKDLSARRAELADKTARIWETESGKFPGHPHDPCGLH